MSVFHDSLTIPYPISSRHWNNPGFAMFCCVKLELDNILLPNVDKVGRH